MLSQIYLTPDGRLAGGHPVSIQPDTWYAFVDKDVRLHPNAAQIVLKKAHQRPDVGIFYADEAVIRDGASLAEKYLLKTTFDLTQFIAQDYIGWPIFVSGRALSQIPTRDGLAGTAETYDLLLHALSLGIAVERITEILSVRFGAMKRAMADDRVSALHRWLKRMGSDDLIVPGRLSGTFEFRRRFEDFPNVTLVIPTRQSSGKLDEGQVSNVPFIMNMLDSIRATDWPMDKLSVLIGDDVADGRIYEEKEWPFSIQRILTQRPHDRAFNYAAKMNVLWREAQSEYVVFMNDDLVALSPGWLRALLTFAIDEKVGGVSARLLYPDYRLQHVGMAAGVRGPCTHAFIGAPADQPTYQNWADIHREWSIVTGAVFATRRSVLEHINGFDETFTLDFNDVDMCLRLRILGYKIVYTPHAELIHYESASRGLKPIPAHEVALFYERWGDYMVMDPSYHPRLVRDTSDISPLPCQDEWWQ